MRGLLAQDVLLAGLPGFCSLEHGPLKLFKLLELSFQWHISAFVSITVARQLGNCTPFRFIIPVLSVMSCYVQHCFIQRPIRHHPLLLALASARNET